MGRAKQFASTERPDGKDVDKTEPRKLVPVMEATGLYHVEWNHGAGNIPDILQGKFTNVMKVIKAIETYSAKKEDKVNA